MKEKLIEYATKSCPSCPNAEFSVFDNICGKCGNWLHFRLDTRRIKKEWMEYTKKLDTNKIVLRDMLEYLFPADLFNFVVWNALNMLFINAQRRIKVALNQIENFPEVASNRKENARLKSLLEDLKRYFLSYQKNMKKKQQELNNMAVKNPLYVALAKYTILWKEMQQLKDSGQPLPKEKVMALQGLIKEVQNYKGKIKAGYTQLRENLERFLESAPEKTEDPGLNRVKLEYRTVMSLLKDMNETTLRKLQDPDLRIDIRIYKINVLLNKSW